MYPGLNYARLSEATIASTTSITVTTDITRISGSTAIATIVAPINNVPTVIFVVPTSGTLTTVTTGNIALAISMPVNQVTVFTYSPTAGKWNPGAI